MSNGRDDQGVAESLDPLDEIDEPDEQTLARIEADEVEPYPVIDPAYIAELSPRSRRSTNRRTFDDRDDLDSAVVGRLVSPGADEDSTGALYAIYSDDEPDAIGLSFEQGDLSAEEEAVHLVSESYWDVEDDL